MTSAPTTTRPMDLKVPVDELEIVNDPGKGRLGKHRAALRQFHVVCTDIQLSFRTGASELLFKRRVRCYEIIKQEDGSFLFDAFLEGHRLLCEFDLSTRTGKAVPHPEKITESTRTARNQEPEKLYPHSTFGGGDR